MCGIVGRVNADAAKPVSLDELRAATRRVAHRGPDGEGLFCEGPVGLGHRRLAIVDVAAGAQPMHCPEDRLTVVFNGEIYNHAELRSELQARGYTFRTRSDTEVLLHGYHAWGDRLLPRLRGMFAFAIWDSAAQRLFLARDRVGIKPLYFARLPSGDLVFASEVKSLFDFADVPRAVDPSAVPAYLALRYVPGPRTLWRGVRRLDPGFFLTFDRGGRISARQYWDVPVHASSGQPKVDLREEAERLEQLLRETVRMHLMGEVPVGLFLSGGIDSSSIGWAMKQAEPSSLKTFAVGFDDGDREEELRYARLVANVLGAEHREVRVSAQAFRDGLFDLVYHLDEPNADGACIPLMHLSRRAREEVTVVLSGEGADELFGGYGIYRRLLAIERARTWMGDVLGTAARATLPWVTHPKLRRYLRMVDRPLEAHYFGVGRGFPDELLVEAFGEDAVRTLADGFGPLWARSEGAPALHRLLYTDTRVWLPDDLLIKADKMTMSAAIELRVPFLDHVMLENAWRLPPSAKVQGHVGKVLVRRALRGKLPDAVLTRPKKGFPVPIGRWLRTSLYGACREQLLATGSFVRDLLGAPFLRRLLEEHRRGERDRTEPLYALWVLEVWQKALAAPRETPLWRNEVKRTAPTLFDAPRASDADAEPIRAAPDEVEP